MEGEETKKAVLLLPGRCKYAQAKRGQAMRALSGQSDHWTD